MGDYKPTLFDRIQGFFVNFSRRDFLKISGATIAAGLTSTVVYLGVNDERGDLVVKHVSIPIEGLHPALEGFTIVQLTDIHIYPITPVEVAEEAVAIANSLKPDLAVLTGDYVWREGEAIFDLAPVLAGLNANQGLYAIIGNHDIWEGLETCLSGLREAGIPVLINQGLTISKGGGALYLAGLDDGMSGQPDLSAALEGMPAGAPVVLLMHEPDPADEFSLDGRISLQLSGHTHGGQVRIKDMPMVLPPLGRKYDLGLYSINGMWLYVSPGIGEISVPLRYNCPPEVSVFTLERA
jgi:predicted MPP superfamily phosphohydrolase